MSIKLRIVLLLVSFLTFFAVYKQVSKQKMNTELGSHWLLWGLGLLGLNLFPDLLKLFGFLLGIDDSISVLAFFLILLLYLLLFAVYSRLSLLEEKTRNIIELLGIEDKEKNDEKAASED